MVFVITDNQSPWTLGCYGNEDILTPNVARLADEGVRFTNAFCGIRGKRRLGDSLNSQLGFRYWYAKPKGHTQSFYNDEAIWQGRVIRETCYYLEAITDHAIDFLRQAAANPFFLYVADTTGRTGWTATYSRDTASGTQHITRIRNCAVSHGRMSIPG